MCSHVPSNCTISGAASTARSSSRRPPACGVTRFVELRAEVNIGVRNAPAGVELSVLPSTATVVFRCVFPTPSDPAENTSFYIDYKDFANSITGRCVARCSGLPATVLGYDMQPEVFDCVVKNSR